MDAGSAHMTDEFRFAVPTARVFAVPADPTTHAAIDGTGWVQEPADHVLDPRAIAWLTGYGPNCIELTPSGNLLAIRVAVAAIRHA
jgi:hypothetical protein